MISEDSEEFYNKFTQKTIILNSNNISQYYCFYSIGFIIFLLLLLF